MGCGNYSKYKHYIHNKLTFVCLILLSFMWKSTNPHCLSILLNEFNTLLKGGVSYEDQN